MKFLRRLRPIKGRPCICGHDDLLHMGLTDRCLASLGNGSDNPRRFSDLCCEVSPGGCHGFIPAVNR